MKLNGCLRDRTGLHTVADVFCVGCNERIGWYYHKAADAGQKYKEGEAFCPLFMHLIVEQSPPGKYLLERAKIVKSNAWTLDDEI